MAGLLNTSSVMMCPHGGTVSAVTANARAKAAGAFVLRSSDTFPIAGCAFSTSAGPHPCVRVQWVTPAARVQVAGDFVLTEGSVGLCLAADMAPQGTVMVTATQPKVAGL